MNDINDIMKDTNNIINDIIDIIEQLCHKPDGLLVTIYFKITIAYWLCRNAFYSCIL